MSNINRFLKELPGPFKKVHDVLSTFGLTPISVGGIPRDYLMKGEIGRDWDIEVISNTVTWSKDLWKDLGKALSAAGNVTHLPYEVIRVEKQNFQFEISPPRSENFVSDWEVKGHSNFEATFDLKLPFEKSVKRRDFTVNAIGIKILSENEAVLLDPLDGVRHIHDRSLHPAGDDFAKDPIRFLRALRFKRKLGFELSADLEKILGEMKIKKLAPVHLWAEMQKSSDPLGLYCDLVDCGKDLELPFGKEILSKKEEVRKVLIDPTKHEAWLIALEWAGLPCSDWQQYFSLSGDLCKRLSRWAHATKAFSKIRPEVFHGEFEAVRELPDFELLFDWYFTTKQLLQKNGGLPLMSMIQEYVPDWGHLYKFGPVKDVKHIDPPYRAKYQVWNLCQRL